MRNRKEQEEAVRRLNRYIRYIKSCGNTQSKHFKAVVIVLKMLKEKDAEIEKYKKLLADNLAKELNNSIKAKEKANTDLEFLNLGWKTEIEKKDKMIDLMAEELQKHIFVLYDGDTITSKKGIIEHYEREAANDG